MNEPTISVSASFLLELHSQSSPAGKELIEAYIRNYKKDVDRKGHVTEGFRRTTEGGLMFDPVLYDEAVYRGKIDTYSRNAKEQIAALKDSLELLQHMSRTQQQLLSTIPSSELGQRVGVGTEISEEDLQLLSRIQPYLTNDPEA